MPRQLNLCRWFQRLLFIVTLLLMAGGTNAAETKQTASLKAAQPNIVLIISDDQGWSDYSFMGHPQIRTPNLDKLAAESLTFTRGYVPASLCCPSLASILTGQYPQQHKVTGNDPPNPKGVPRKEFYKTEEFLGGRERMNRFVEQAPSLPRLLGERGYVSFQTGKWWLGNFRRGGFTHGMTDGDPLSGGRHGDAGLKIGRETMQPIYNFIDEATTNNKPFFVWYAPMMPHLPHNPPERFLRNYRDKTNSIHVAKYWACVEWFDETCGQLLNHLDQRGLKENTIVVYVTDNGWHQSVDNPEYAPKSKQSQYDGGLRTPIMLRWPGKIKPEKSASLASSIDLAPTLLAAAGIKKRADMPGIDLFDRNARKRDTIYGSCFTHDILDLDAPEKSLRWRWCIEKDWKLIVPSKTNEASSPIELYDLSNDPHEERNMASKDPKRVAQLQKQLDAWWDVD